MPPALGSRRERARLGAWLVAPALGVMLLAAALPILHAVRLSLFRHRITDPGARAFVGLRNYAVVLSDPLWWRDVGTTAAIAVVCVSAELVLGLAIALVMHRATTGRRWVRAAVLLPYGIVTVVSAFSWRYAFALDTGFVNAWLGLGALSWFGHPASSFVAICAAEIWKTTPFMSLLLLAGLSQVPEELLEAARVDGAGPLRRLVGVTLPSMRTAIAVAVLFRALDAFRIFDSIFVMTGGAQRTESVSFLAYRQVIGRTAIGLGSAVSVLLFLSVILVAVVLVKALRIELGGRGQR
jgi:multiple sugar transport system permease protein